MNQIKHNKNYKISLSKNSSLKPLIFKTIQFEQTLLRKIKADIE